MPRACTASLSLCHLCGLFLLRLSMPSCLEGDAATETTDSTHKFCTSGTNSSQMETPMNALLQLSARELQKAGRWTRWPGWSRWNRWRRPNVLSANAFDMQEMIQAFGRGRLCKMVQDPLGSGAACKKGLDCKDPMYAICCTDVCELHVAASCSDYSPACQARVAACEMASFMADDGFLLAQPALFVAPKTYGENQIFDVRSMGGYSTIVWKLLQDLTSLCYQLEWLRNDSSLLAKLSNYTGCQNIDESCPNSQASFETWPAGAEALHGSTKALISGGEQMARQIMKSAWGFSGGVGGIVLTTFLNLALSGASGPTNPCTYAATADWGKCVYGQIAKYVEQHVTSYVAKEFQHYTNEVAKTRLAVWHLKLNDINNSVAIDTRKPGQNTTSNWLADFTDPVQELRFDMDGEWLRFLLTPVLPQFLNLHLTVESLALKAKQLRDAASIQKLARDSLCHAKMVLKRAANLTQRRVASFQGLMVHRKHHLEWVTHSSLLSHVIFFHRHTYDCPYYYPGQFDAECTSKEAVDKSNSTCTPKPPSFSPCLYCRDRGDGIPIPFLGDKAQCAPWETSSPGGAAATSWFCHRAKVLSTQQRVFEQWLQPIWNWINITRALQQAMENGEVPKWSPWSWKCYDEANLKSDQGLLGRMASCPFRILTTSSFEGKPSYVDRGTGAATDLGMWRPKRGSKGLYYLGDYCKDSHAADMHLTAMLLQHMPGHEDSLKSPVTMTFNWNDLHTHGDHDGGLFTPGCAEGYRPVGSVGEQDLPDSRAGPDNPPPPSRFNGLVCVKAEYTEEVHLTKDDWMWTDRRSHGHYDGAVFVGAVYMTASGVLVYGPCHAARGHPSHYTVYRVKESLVRWCTGMPAG